MKISKSVEVGMIVSLKRGRYVPCDGKLPPAGVFMREERMIYKDMAGGVHVVELPTRLLMTGSCQVKVK